MKKQILFSGKHKKKKKKKKKKYVIKSAELPLCNNYPCKATKLAVTGGGCYRKVKWEKSTLRNQMCGCYNGDCREAWNVSGCDISVRQHPRSEHRIPCH